VVEGRVVNSATGEPIVKARVILSPAGTYFGMSAGRDQEAARPRPAPVVTDSQGHFKIENAEPGTYTLAATRRGFVPARFSGERPSGGAQLLTLKSGERLSDLTISMTQAGVISGRVFEADGEVAVRVRVEALMSGTMQGKQQLIPVEETQTNDFGEFRLFDLRPGRYIVRASPGGYAGVSFRLAERLAEGMTSSEEVAPSYYPGTTDAARAEPVEVRSGQEVRADLTLFTTRTYHIRGRVNPAPREEEKTHVSVSALPVERGLFDYRHGREYGAVGKEGAFHIAGVAPGAYYVVAMEMSEKGRGRQGRTRVEVASHDVENVLIALSEGADIPGRVRFESAPPAELSGLQVVLMGGQQAVYDNAQAEVDKTGAFKLSGIHDNEYRVSVLGLPEGYYIRSARAGSVDCTDEPLSVRGGVPGPLELLIAKGTATVSGTVRDADGNPVPGAAIMLAEEKDSAMFGYFGSGLRTTQSDAGGNFRFSNLGPGKYRLIAFQVMDVDVMEAGANFEAILKSQGQQVTLGVGASQSIELKLARFKEPPQ
jgi:protocatechuate 3,4-dioxygenase beta subunit